jgi:hypothetical protein
MAKINSNASTQSTDVDRRDSTQYDDTKALLDAVQRERSRALKRLAEENSNPLYVWEALRDAVTSVQVWSLAAGGMEQSVWDPNTGTFFVSIPQLGVGGASDPGGVSEIDTTGKVLRTISFASLGITSCSPAGLAVGASGNLMVGCGNVGAAAILLNPTGAGSIVKTFAGLGGTDELWYDPATNAFYVTGNNGSNTTRFFDIVTDNGAASSISQMVDLPDTTSAHSITVDPFNGDVFVALAGTAGPTGVNPCPMTFANPGCIEVFGPAATVPEPASLPLLAVGLAGLIGLAVRRRLQ